MIQSTPNSPGISGFAAVRQRTPWPLAILFSEYFGKNGTTYFVTKVRPSVGLLLKDHGHTKDKPVGAPF